MKISFAACRRPLDTISLCTPIDQKLISLVVMRACLMSLSKRKHPKNQSKRDVSARQLAVGKTCHAAWLSKK